MNATTTETVRTALKTATKRVANAYLDGDFCATDRDSDVVVEFKTVYGGLRDITSALTFAMDEIRKLGLRATLAHKALIVSEA